MSGLVEALKIVKDVEGIGFVYFDDKDVVRHKLVQQIVKAYDAFTNGRARMADGDSQVARDSTSRSVTLTVEVVTGRGVRPPAGRWLRRWRPRARAAPSPSPSSPDARVRALNRELSAQGPRQPTCSRSRTRSAVTSATS